MAKIKGPKKTNRYRMSLRSKQFNERTHHGRNMKGRVPYKAFVDGIVKPDKMKKNKLKKAA